jgi:hypothetical protein
VATYASSVSGLANSRLQIDHGWLPHERKTVKIISDLFILSQKDIKVLLFYFS